MAFIYRNPHPEHKRVGDCMKRAIVLSTLINYHDIQVMLNRYKKLKGNCKDWWKDFIVEVLGAEKYDVDMIHAYRGRRYTVAEFAKEHSTKAILRVSKHLVHTKDGNYYDTWDSGEKGVYIAWFIPKYYQVVDRLKTTFPALCKGLTLDRYAREL